MPGLRFCLSNTGGQLKSRPLVVCGPSGVGKGTLLVRLAKEYPTLFGSVVSHTTRAARPGEEDGVAYHFTTVENMEREIAAGGFIEHARVHNNIYGKSKKSVQDVQAQGKVCILELDVQGAETIKTTDLHAYFLFIAPPSLADLEQRLRGRGTESEEQIKVRSANAAAEMAYMDKPGFFDRVLLNHDLEKAYADLKAIIATSHPETASVLLTPSV